eukprot:gnl/TRDRNA2_/TRDRNA2_42110_c0_seq1.p1 gnl/TRDRNA2_/TRDRNA2_42110_c0~~gnl/TRDRNA2_/TRDRNA2_42110_c0_seq1.p1  ORF type:complete len:540 (-),score=129.25 gnl/TRDRNA2_/TRDRNA2_42110_c0_seq1:49-1599(-)
MAAMGIGGPMGGGGMAPPPADTAPPDAMAQAAMAQAYAQMFTSYLQQAQAYAAANNDPNVMGAGTMGLSSPSFPPMMSYPSPDPLSSTISVSVEGMKFLYQLTEDDLHKVFSRYGVVTKISLDEAGTSASIAFETMQQAQAAMQDLNGKVLNGLEGTLRIAWASAGGVAGAAPPSYPMMPPLPSWGFAGPAGAPPWPPMPGMPGVPAAAPPTNGNAGKTTSFSGSTGGQDPSTPQRGQRNNDFADMSTGKGLAGNASQAPLHVKGVRKYTCRFLIGIENDKEFQVVRRIIGAKGANMKKIVKQTEAKLRLRGVGSGYFEGAGQKESSEPLQLCVSCTTPEGYRTAVKLVEELLEGVHAEYRSFCRENGRPEPDLHVTPQLVDGSRAKGVGQHNPGALGGLGGNALRDMDDDDDDDEPGVAGTGETGSPGAQRRRRGRRSRVKRGGANEQGDPPPKAPPVEEIQRMIDLRNEARRQCNFAEADRVRQELHERGVALMDEPGGRGKGSEVTTWRYWRD